LEALPLTPHGKLDRKALPAPDTERPTLLAPFVAPRTPTEALVTQIWVDMLGLNKVGIYDNFFTLGGHSLLATQMITKLRDIFRVELPLRIIFDNPTVNGLTDAIAHHWGSRDRVDEIAKIFQALDQLSDEDVRTMLFEQL
jgi:acyl carrier protein